MLKLGKPAIPALIEALEDPKLSFEKRAWILVALHTLSEERPLNPYSIGMSTRTTILPSYISISPHGRGSMHTSPKNHDEVSQKEFAKGWLKFRDDYLVVEKVEE